MGDLKDGNNNIDKLNIFIDLITTIEEQVNYLKHEVLFSGKTRQINR